MFLGEKVERDERPVDQELEKSEDSCFLESTEYAPGTMLSFTRTTTLEVGSVTPSCRCDLRLVLVKGWAQITKGIKQQCQDAKSHVVKTHAVSHTWCFPSALGTCLEQKRTA